MHASGHTSAACPAFARGDFAPSRDGKGRRDAPRLKAPPPRPDPARAAGKRAFRAQRASDLHGHFTRQPHARAASVGDEKNGWAAGELGQGSGGETARESAGRPRGERAASRRGRPEKDTPSRGRPRAPPLRSGGFLAPFGAPLPIGRKQAWISPCRASPSRGAPDERLDLAPLGPHVLSMARELRFREHPRRHRRPGRAGQGFARCPSPTQMGPRWLMPSSATIFHAIVEARSDVVRGARRHRPEDRPSRPARPPRQHADLILEVLFPVHQPILLGQRLGPRRARGPAAGSSTLCTGSQSRREEPDRDVPGLVDGGRIALVLVDEHPLALEPHEHPVARAVDVRRARPPPAPSRAARMAASFRRLARSAPEKPGVPRAM